VNYLLDTHVMLWWLTGRELSPEANRILDQLENTVFVSPVSAWELHVKAAKGQLTIDGSPLDAIFDCGFEILNVAWSHAVAAAELPQHHKDPFDRLLIGQAMVEAATLISRDAVFGRYDVALIKA
jgi:PIN domain nuclease of toxin-antitoxin system